MKLLFDLNSLRPPRSGVGYYTQHLLEGLWQRPEVEAIAGWAGATVYEGQRLQEVMRDEAVSAEAARVTHGLAAAAIRAARNVPGAYQARTFLRNCSSTVLRDDFARRGYLYHETNFIASRYRGPTVVTIHDLSHRPYPEFHPREAVRYLDAGLPRTLKQAQAVIAVSHYTKQVIHDLFGLPDEKVVTIHLGVESSFHPYDAADCEGVLSVHGLRRRGFILSVCTLQPRKNLPRLVDAFGRLPTRLRDAFPLVLIGADGWMNSELKRRIVPLIEARQLVVPGYVSRHDLTRLFASAAIFAYPSLYEGFGLPVVEAMASGTPVLTSNVTSLPEVAGGAALQIDPRSVDAIADGLERLADDAELCDTLAKKGLLRAAEFTWESTVEKTCGVYRSLAM
ncbi:glycosyltransferase family 4 protein [Burkholderia multivorans]|uniref:glycosyltransferase family 4 protein n=1 Tax=Burkholderia multivorans TaxID=87883 RepID=UPI00080A8AC5|nr:glycosyltransferase family 1 protein [Burkholderia multivorans]MBU9239574.1 glycosyltransferase family 4 protein [Burkholderia multivorans]MDN7951107.1 glycosyltransferase family 1 protein [Burkholderia multivorans]MDN8033078.1 glycosyltransferase family 1 protein [Burkholderia multivorans]HEF4749163.1 glycosyltransferase family 4 protein [Burkholderia multivorans]HEM7810596.1 glycosyltransferase family 4 protein [Burkholderia multivorans]